MANMLPFGGTANAGTSSKIAPSIKKRFGDIMNRAIQGGITGARMVDPRLHEMLSQQEKLEQDERFGQANIDLTQQKLGLEERKVGLLERQEIDENATTVLGDVWPQLPPKSLELAVQTLKNEGLQVSPNGRVNTKSLVGTLERISKDKPEILKKVFSSATEELDGGIANLTTMIKQEAAKMGHKLFPGQGALSDEEMANKVLSDPNIVAQNKKLQSMVATRDQNKKYFDTINKMRGDFEREAEESKLTPSTEEIIRAQTDPTVAAALAEKQRQKIEVARAQAEARIEAGAAAERELPIPTNEVTKYVNNQGQFAPAGLTPSQAQSLGYFPISEAFKTQVLAIGNVENIISEMQPVIDELFTAEGFADRIRDAIKGGVQFTLQQGPDAENLAFYEALKDGVAGQFAQIVSGEGGKLTEGDIQRTKSLFPTLFNQFGVPDTKAVAQRKIKFLAKALEQQRRIILNRSGIKPKGSLFDKEVPPELPRRDTGIMTDSEILQELNK